MQTAMGPLITSKVFIQLRKASGMVECSLDLDKSQTTVEVNAEGFVWNGKQYPHLSVCKDRTVYYWDETGFEPVARYSGSLIKLVPTEWGPPTFEIDGIKMLPTAQVSPYADAQNKVKLIQPQGKVILDCCGGLGYFASWCLQMQAGKIISFEKNPDVIWLRSLNPWSPQENGIFTLNNADVSERIAGIASESVDAILHDPPRFGIAGELYSQVFYDHLARALKRKGRLFHYTGTPNKLTSGRDVPNEVSQRLRRAGFGTEVIGDGVLAIKK